MDAQKFIYAAKTGKIDIIEHTKKVLAISQEIDSEYNYFNVISNDAALKQAEELHKQKEKKGALFGLPISVKDCICVKGVESRAGSKILSGYKPVFDATVIEKVKAEGGIIIGKTSQDEFGFGSFSTNVGIDMKIPKNPIDKERTCGGSSGGAAGITNKCDFSHVAVAESTGGSIAAPASYCGIIGFTPTYGRVSRYGLMDYANSLDKIGVMGKAIEDCALVFQVIAGYDDKDSTSINVPVPNYLEATKNKSKFKIGIIKESISEGVDESVKDSVKNIIIKLKKHGNTIEEVSLPLVFKYGIQAYYLISMSEASTNLAKYCGLRYGYAEELNGNFNEYFSKVRSHGFSKEAKRRIILGTFARMAGLRDEYYLKAMKVRTLMAEEYAKLFEKYDLLLSPTMPNVAPRFDNIKNLTPLQNYMMDIMTAGPNLCGLPHISVPYGEHDEMPIGVLFTAKHMDEEKLFGIAASIKNLHN